MNKTLLCAAILHAMNAAVINPIYHVDVRMIDPDDYRKIVIFTIFVREGDVRAPTYRGLRADFDMFAQDVVRWPMLWGGMNETA